MNQIKCPKCGEVFSIDESNYASIVSQVRDAEFHSEVERRIGELTEQNKAAQQAASALAEQKHQNQLNQKDSEIQSLKAKLASAELQKKTELTLALTEKDKTISALQNQISQSDSKLQLAVMEEKQKSFSLKTEAVPTGEFETSSEELISGVFCPAETCAALENFWNTLGKGDGEASEAGNEEPRNKA